MSFAEYDLKKIGIFFTVLIIFILAIAGASGSFYYYKKYKSAEKLIRDSSLTSNESVAAVVDRVGKLIKLPEGETPTVATVSDLSKLKNQAFFAKAKIGDKVLLYMQAKKAILYDPVGNVIVEVGPLVIPTPTVSLAIATGSAGVAGIETRATVALQPISIAIYNSTNINNLSDLFEKDLNEKIKNIRITEKSKSQKRDYAKSVVIDLTGKNAAVAEAIAKELNLSVSALSSEEKSPEGADLLIILAADRQP